jgi:hypothetical protein
MEYISMVLLPIFLLMAITICSIKATKDKFILSVILAITGLKFLLIISDQLWGFLAYKPDAGYYFHFGKAILNSGSWLDFFELTNKHHGPNAIGILTYSIINSICFSLFGSYRHVMPMINTFIYSLSILILTNAIKTDLSGAIESNAQRVFTVLAFTYPGGLNNSIVNLRETFLIFFCSLLIFVLMSKREKILRQPYFYLAILLAVMIRPFVLPIIAVIILLFNIIFLKKIKIWRLIVFAFIIGAVGVLFIRYTKIMFSYEIIKNIVETRSESGLLVYPVELTYNSLIDLVNGIPQRIFYFLFYPFPWQLESYNFIIPTLDAIFLLLLILGLLLSRFFVLRKIDDMNSSNKNVYFLTASGLIGMIAVAIMEAKVGGAIRHRVPFVLIFCAASSIPISATFLSCYNKLILPTLRRTI